MEFSYKISESEFRRAWKVERKASSRASLKTAAFWISVMLGLLLLFKSAAAGQAAPRPFRPPTCCARSDGFAGQRRDHGTHGFWSASGRFW